MPTRTRFCLRTAAIFSALPFVASAHVKWFCNYDVTQPTKPLAAVLDRNFFLVLAMFVALVFLAFCADGWALKRWPRLGLSAAGMQELPEKLMRLGTGAFFLCTWNIGLNILTPELHTQAPWIFAVQFVTALGVAWRRTCVVSAAGICALYAYGVDRYGFFHMLDYVYFLGMAAYLALASFPARWSWLRMPLLSGCLAFSLIWTAIEKLLYPQWSQQLMLKHPHMMMGMPFGLFILVAALVEFTLAFYLATGRALLRLGAVALLALFISAMPEFGARDVLGHFPLVAILSVPFLAGCSALQRFWRWPSFGIAANAAMTCLLYVAALSVFLLLYGGAQRIGQS